jgi:hypothetical protein
LQFDYLQSEQNSDDVLADLDNSEDHGAGSVFFQLCSKYKSVCNKVSRAGSFTEEDKTLKLAYVTYLLKKLDENISR